MVTEAKKIVKRVSFVFIQKLFTGVSLLALVVIVAAGVIGGSRLTTIMWKAALAIGAVMLVNRIIIRILVSYEEMNSGKG